MLKYNRNIKGIVTIVLLLFKVNVGFTQKSDAEEVPDEIKVIARPFTDNRILVRWGSTTPISFRKLNKYGYQLKRYTISISGQTLDKPIEKNLGFFKPAQPEEWLKVIESNNNAAIVAQSIFGKSFDVQGVGAMQGIINMSQEQQQRFTWALYACDQDFEVAKLAGLGFEDVEIKATEKYVYKVYSMVPETEMKIRDGGVFIGMQDYEALPKPLDVAAVFNDGRVMLNWNYKIHKTLFNSYFIERSTDGKNFKTLNKLPYTSLNSGGKVDTKRIYYIDSIPNDKIHYYRVKGRTPFGELSPASDIISGRGQKLLAFSPKITSKEIINDEKSVILEWEFSKEGNQHIKGFEVNRSDKVDGEYKTVVNNISPSTRKIRYDNIAPTNYITITALGKKGSNTRSYPVLVQPIDSIPPVKPIGLQGKVDSLGVVSLSWKANTETDMLGYRVFRGNNKNEEYTQVTVAPHRATTYYDSISVKMLNDKVYYKIVAVDQRFNMSEYSNVLKLDKPDYNPPSPPIVISYEVKKEKMFLKWANSSSKDVKKHEVYRRIKNNTPWNLITTIPQDSLKKEYTNWEDANIEGGRTYQYLIKAVDDSNLSSKNIKPVTIEVPRFQLLSGVKGFGSYVDKTNGFIELFWKVVQEKNVAELMIYKSLKGKKASLLRSVPSTIKRIVDEDVKPNNIYSYIIRPVFIDGSLGQVKMIEVTY